MLTLAHLQNSMLHDVIKYLLSAGALALLLWLLRERLQGRRLQARRPTPANYRREIGWSLLTACLFAGASLVGIFWVARQGWSQLYWNLDEYGLTYAGYSLLLMIVAHDAYFYWTHRLLHQPRLMRWAHRLHHLSRTPTPWAAYAFHPGEALLHTAFPILFAFVLPVHPLVQLLWSIHMIVRNVIGHCGHELMPRWMIRSGWFDWLTTTTHHDLHHQYGRHNYGLYFTWWDRWLGTEHPEYRARLASAVGLTGWVAAHRAEAQRG
ncbi:sterol desaturase family protein [Pseudomonas sp. N040]|uniref:sterol desaturase family protein n=1 Tax=Pseudomonas sp. N040 TaxID=2785325 RepID=UPI0018A25907|nr:sterol desaturase family protein [Pseudomonas sp. N040]MBF7730941.1 sterol desaturase family protein [Pseudomonas sp. N040]MBW7014584.1 sterol desaturase family protein [Pseudomonas sp. N040]